MRRAVLILTCWNVVIVGEQLAQAFFGEPVGGGFRRNLIPAIEKRLDVSGSKPLVIRHRQNDGNVSILPTDDDRLSVGVVQNRPERVFRLCRGYSLHRQPS